MKRGIILFLMRSSHGSPCFEGMTKAILTFATPLAWYITIGLVYKGLEGSHLNLIGVSEDYRWWVCKPTSRLEAPAVLFCRLQPRLHNSNKQSWRFQTLRTLSRVLRPCSPSTALGVSFARGPLVPPSFGVGFRLLRRNQNWSSCSLI